MLALATKTRRLAPPALLSALLWAACNAGPGPSHRPTGETVAAEAPVAAASKAVAVTQEPSQPATAAHTAGHALADQHASCGQAQGSCGASCGQSEGQHASCGQAEGSCGQAEGSCGGGCGEHAAAPGSCGAHPTQQASASDDFAAPLLTRVEDPSQICMVRNHFMGRPQLAIQAEGSTYYGCCAGCANRLLQDPQARKAVDPVSHNPVDKALAVLAKTPRGSILYFENEANMQQFQAALR